MKISGTTVRIAAVLGTLAVLTASAASAQASGTRPAAMTKAEYQALMIRGEALNRRYGNAVTRLTAQQFKGLYEAGADRLPPQEFAALLARSQELNRRYASSSTRAQPKQVVATANSPAAVGFDWGDFGIGAAAMLGLVLLTGGLVAGSRYGRRVERARIS